MINLKEETIEILKHWGKTVDDVMWVGSMDGKYALSWLEFEKIADKIEYDNGYGGQEIYEHLVVVGNDWWLERYEYDGAERWDLKSHPTLKHDAMAFVFGENRRQIVAVGEASVGKSGACDLEETKEFVG